MEDKSQDGEQIESENENKNEKKQVRKYGP